MAPKAKPKVVAQKHDGARQLIESTSALYAARIVTPLLLTAIGALTYGAWSDLKDVGKRMTESLWVISDRLNRVEGEVKTEIQIRALSDEEIKRRIKELERPK